MGVEGKEGRSGKRCGGGRVMFMCVCVLSGTNWKCEMNVPLRGKRDSG